jgi:hypothetical protein
MSQTRFGWVARSFAGNLTIDRLDTWPDVTNPQVRRTGADLSLEGDTGDERGHHVLVAIPMTTALAHATAAELHAAYLHRLRLDNSLAKPLDWADPEDKLWLRGKADSIFGTYAFNSTAWSLTDRDGNVVAEAKPGGRIGAERDYIARVRTLLVQP